MTSDDIIRMAEAASILGKYDDLAGAEWRQDTIQELERFAALVAAAEREACADICDQHASVEGIAQRCADAIRARSKE